MEKPQLESGRLLSSLTMFQTLLQLLLIAYLLVTLVQIAIWYFVYRQVNLHKDLDIAEHKSQSWPAISVIVCTRNNLTDLQAHLPQWLDQEYGGLFELVIVDDASTDGTNTYLSKALQNDPRLQAVILSEKKLLGKKAALAAGLGAAKHDYVLLTDVDCRPASKHWISYMALPFMQGKQIVLGFAPLEKTVGWISVWQRFETCYIAIQYCAWALVGMPYMGVGRNLAYRKSLFEQAGGFTTHSDLPSGDDDLFINATAQKNSVGICLHPDAFMYSKGKPDFASYYRQKTRHFSTGHRYRFWHQIVLSAVGLSHSLHYFFLLLLLLAQLSTVFVLLIAVIRIVIIILVCRPTLKRLHEQELTNWLPVFDPFIAVYYTVFIPGIFLNTFNKPRSWT